MKNTEIHNGLEYAKLRNILAKQLTNVYNKMQSVNQEIHVKRPDVIRWSGYDYQKEHNILSEQLRVIEERKAIATIIKQMGWNTFDVSDITENDIPFGMVYDFIGTMGEYESLKRFINQQIQMVGRRTRMKTNMLYCEKCRDSTMQKYINTFKGLRGNELLYICNRCNTHNTVSSKTMNHED